MSDRLDHLRRKASDFDEVLRVMGDLYVKIDRDDLIVDCRLPSRLAEEASPAQLAGKRMDAVLPAAFVGAVAEDLASARDTGRMSVVETLNSWHGGSPRWFEVRMLPVGDGAVVIVARDVTERHESAQKQRENSERFTAVVANAPIGFHLFELCDGELVFRGANSAADTILGIDHAGLVGRTFGDAFPELGGTDARRILSDIAAHGGSWAAERVAFSGATTEGPYAVTAYQIGPNQVAVALIDASKRVRTEQRLLDSERLLRLAQRTAEVGYFVYRFAEDKWMSSDQMDRIAGIDDTYPRSYQSWIDLIHEDDKVWASAYILECVESGRPFDCEVKIRRASDDEMRWVHVVGTLEADDEGQPSRVFGIIHDVTSRVEAHETERRYARRLSATAADLARAEERERRTLAEGLHDRVIQPLAVARMRLTTDTAAGVAVRPWDVDSARELVDAAIAEARALTTELSPPVLFELGLSAALRWQCEDLEKSMGLSTHLTLCDDDLGLDDEAKTVLLRSARELLVNVVKHSGTDEAWLSLDALGDDVVLTVSDAGRGHADAIDGGIVEQGFGLFSIRDRLPHLGGELAVESAPDKGLCVTLRVPRQAG